MKKISFILPCYNVAPYFGRCIESIEHQDIPQSEYEVICIDDCSKDNTVEVIMEYQKQYHNIRLICHTENKTAGGARNTGLDAAKGKYIWCVDPDDAIQINSLGTLYERVEQLNLDILFFNLSLLEEDGKVMQKNNHRTHEEIYTGVDYTITWCAPDYLYNVASHTGCLFSKAFLDVNRIRYPEIRSSQDVAFMWHSILLAKRVSAVSNICYNIYKRPLSTTGSKGKYRAESVISTVLFYVAEIDQYRGICGNQIIDDNLLFDMRLTVNDDSRKVLRMSLKEQHRFHNALRNNSLICDRYMYLMNRKTKVILNYRLPYLIWQLMMWGYTLKNWKKG